MVAHLAGALGAPVWLMLHFAADWRWLLDRSDSPWYPTMRLFRQKRPGDWDGVVAEIAAALRQAKLLINTGNIAACAEVVPAEPGFRAKVRHVEVERSEKKLPLEAGASPPSVTDFFTARSDEVTDGFQ